MRLVLEVNKMHYKRSRKRKVGENTPTFMRGKVSVLNTSKGSVIFVGNNIFKVGYSFYF